MYQSLNLHSIQSPSFGQGLLLLLLLSLSYTTGYAVYNLYFHPLAGFPGPFIARSSLLWRMIHSMSGRFHRSIEREHQTHGPVFRVSPNELSFASVASWKAIYGPRPGQPPFVKSEFYEMYGAGFNSLCIGSERDPVVHGRMKRSLAPAFSTKALVEQEGIVQKCIDEFIHKIGPEDAGQSVLNVTEWFEMIAFDILGEMAFGESFHSVEQGEQHFWQKLIAHHLFAITLVDNLRRYPWVRRVGQFVLPKLTVAVRDKHTGYSRQKVQDRLRNKTSRKDFLTNITEKVEMGEVSHEELTAHTSTLVIAGGETVATFMAATTYHLLKTPNTLRKLQIEVRERYSSLSEITAATALQLPYLQAVISEGLRIYPPGSQGFPRTCPGTMIDGVWIPAGTEVYTSAWTVTHSAANFREPYTFIPERWLDPDSPDVKEASQPFSLGPRGCLGRNFAYMEMSLLLAKIHLVYNLELVDERLDWEGSSHLHVQFWKPDLFIRFSRRKA